MTTGPDRKPWWQTRGGVALVGFVAIAGFFLLTEHAAHVFGVLPYPLLLACPLLHFFMHSHHPKGGGSAGGAHQQHHDAGHLWPTILGLRGNSHFGVLHIASNVLVIAGFLLLPAAWRVLYDAQRRQRLATTGAYCYVRHPQYLGFIAIMVGFLLQWPAILTLVMFPVLVLMYVRLARTEEHDAVKIFGDLYIQYAAITPAWIPNLGSKQAGSPSKKAQP